MAQVIEKYLRLIQKSEDPFQVSLHNSVHNI